MRKLTKRSVAIIAASAVAVGGAGVAWAAWTSTGTATVNGTSGTAGGVNISQQSVTGAVRPGHPASVTFTVENTNDYAVVVNQATLSGFAATGCDAAASFEQNPAADLSDVPLAANESKSVTWPNAIKLTADPDNACQTKQFSFTIAVSADSAES